MAQKEEKTQSDRLDEVEMIVEGMCPNCFQMVRNWRVPISEKVRNILAMNNSIDYRTGHKINCGKK